MTTTLKRPILGITIGDPGGVGPEVCAKALNESDIYSICRPLLIGDAVIVVNAISFCNLNLKVNVCQETANGRYTPGTLDVLDLGNLPLTELQHKNCYSRSGQGLL